MKPDLTEHNGRHRLRMHRRFEQREDVVWRALVDPELLSQWYPATVRAFEPQAGGAIEFSYATGEMGDSSAGESSVGESSAGDFGEGDAAMLTSGEVTEFREPAVFAFVELAVETMPREGDSLLRFELRRDGAGSMLLFTQEFDDRPAAASYASGWEACFDVLEELLNAREAGTAQPGTAQPRIPAVARHEMYVHLFGLDRPVVGATQVTAERQLMLQSPQKVWNLLLPDGKPALPRLLPPVLRAADSPGPRVVERVDGERLVLALADRSRVEWEVSTGPGGARLLVTHGPLHGTGGAAGLGSQWRDHIESLVEEIYAAP